MHTQKHNTRGMGNVFESTTHTKNKSTNPLHEVYQMVPFTLFNVMESNKACRKMNPKAAHHFLLKLCRSSADRQQGLDPNVIVEQLRQARGNRSKPSAVYIGQELEALQLVTFLHKEVHLVLKLQLKLHVYGFIHKFCTPS